MEGAVLSNLSRSSNLHQNPLAQKLCLGPYFLMLSRVGGKEKHMERSRKLKYIIGGQWENSVHPLHAFFPPTSLYFQRKLLFRHVTFPTGMSVSEPTPLEFYGLKYLDLREFLTKCHVIFNLQ